MARGYNRPDWLTDEYLRKADALVPIIIETFGQRLDLSAEAIRNWDMSDGALSIQRGYMAEFLRSWSTRKWAELDYEGLWVYPEFYWFPEYFPYAAGVLCLASIHVAEKGHDRAGEYETGSLLMIAAEGPSGKNSPFFDTLTPDELCCVRATLDVLVLRNDEIGREAAKAVENWSSVPVPDSLTES